VPYDDLYRDAAGEPIEGHLTMSSFAWWTARFADAGLVRCDATERRIHPELARMGLTKYWNLYVLRRADVLEPPPDLRSPADAERVRSCFALTGRTASADDAAAVEQALAAAPPLPE
jgi:hypothetical protein